MTTAPINERQPLSLPQSSIRTILAFGIAALFCFMLLVPSNKGEKEYDPHVRVYIYALLPLLMVFFVAQRQVFAGSTLSWISRGLLRMVLVGAIVTVVVMQYTRDSEMLFHRLRPRPDDLERLPFMLLALAGGFIAGHLVAMGPWRKAASFQDFTAWVALVALICMLIALFAEFIVKSSMAQEWNTYAGEYTFTALTAFYFGIRS
jgi:hypothetical protein